MAQFTIKHTPIPGLVEVFPTIHEDERGYFMETYHEQIFSAIGIPYRFIQDNQSRSVKGVLRGLNFQKTKPQAKLVRVLSGQVFDVAVDLRPSSPTYKKWYGVTLCAEQKNQFFIPEGFAHGFLVLTEIAEFAYKCSNFYDRSDEAGILWNDPAIGIEWPDIGMEPIISDKDRVHPLLK